MFALSVLLVLASSAGAGEHGHVQVKAPAGVVVELENHGVSVAEGTEGAVFRDVSVGSHRVRAYRDSFQSQQAVLLVHNKVVTVMRLGPWIPLAATRPTEGFGALIVQTFPVDSTIKSARLGWDNVRKTDAPFVARRVPAGKHKLTFCNSYKCIDHRVAIRSQSVTSLFVDFDYGEVVDKSVADAEQHKVQSDRCLKEQSILDCKLACQRELALGHQGPSCKALGNLEAAGLPMPLEVVPVSSQRRLP